MASFQSGVDKVGEEEGKTANKRENVALQKRRLLRNKRSASISSSPSVSLSSPGATSTTSVLDRRNSVHYFLNSEYQSAYQKSMHSKADGQQQQQQSFMAQRVTITRLRSSTDFLRNESDAAQQTLPSTNSVDIDVHVLCGSSSSVISHMNMKKKKVMARRELPNTRARKSASPLEISPEKVAIKKLQVVDGNPTHPPEMSLSDVTVNMKSSRGKNILKAKEINAAKGKPKIAKLNETAKKKRTGVSKRKSNNKKSSRFTQTENNILQPCRSFIDNKNCPIQLICPYLHSDFPCKYYYLDLQCPHDNVCKFMHNGPLSEKMKDSLRCHILEQMSLNVEDVDGNFLQQIRDKQDLWQCLQDFQNKLKTEWSTKVAGQHEIAKLSVKESTRDQSETDTLYDVEINDQLSFLTQQQKELLYRNYGIKNRQELMQLKLGDLHQIGIIQGDELAAIIHVALNANKRSSERPCHNNINRGHIMSTEVIEVDDDDDDDDYQTKLVIDETCSGDTITNIQDVSSEVNVDKDKTTCQPNHREEIPYANIEDTNSIIASVENRLQQLKNATIPNREKALELITIYDKLSDQEQQIVKNNPGMVLPSQEGVEECYQILKETNVLLDSVYDRLQRLKNNTQITHDEKTVELKDINDQLIQQEQLIKSKSIIGGYNNGNVAKDVENGHSLLNTVTLIGVVDETSVDDDCVMLVCEDDDVRSNETPVTECDNQQKMIDEDEDIHLRFSPADDLVAVEVPNPEAMEIASIEIVPPCPLNEKVNTSLEDPSTENKEELDSYSPNETLGENTNTAITQPAENTEMTINDYEDEDLESSLALEISPMEKEIIDDFSVTRMAEEYKEYEDDSPPYENIVPSKESETEYRQKSPTLTNRKERPRLRSDNAQYMDDVSLTVSQDSDITSTELKVKAYKPRRLKIPKSGGRTKDKTSPKDKVNEEKSPVALTNSNTQDGSAEPKVIMSMRYNKRAKLKMQTVTQGRNLTENCTTDESVESMMSALYAEEGETVNSLKNDESRQSLCSSHNPLNITISTDPLDVNTSAVTTKTRSKLQRNKVISLKIAAGLSKNKRLKSRNITVTKSTVRRRVSFETPDNTVTTNITSNHPTESAADIVNKCHRGKPYVALTKLKPNFLKTLRKQREHDSSSNTSYTTITTTCNITNSTSSGSSKNTTTACTTTSTSPAASFGSNNNCLCDGTFHVLGQKRSCLTNNNNADDEEDDYACDLGTQHKLLKLDSVNILGKNSMEFETTDDNTTTQRITYHKNIVFEDISTTDYYSSSDEKPSEETLKSSTIGKTSSISDNKKGRHQQEEHKIKNIHRKKITNACNKSNMQSPENDEGITITTEDSRDLEKRRRKAKSNAYLQIEGKVQHELNVLDDGAEGDIDENQNVNIKVCPSTPIKSSNKLTRAHLNSNDDLVENYAADDENGSSNKFSSLGKKLSTSQMIPRQIDFDSNSVNVTPIASPTHIVCDSIASPSPVRGGGAGGLLVATVEYLLGEIDARLTYPFMPYILHEIDLSGLAVNKPNNIDKLTKTSSLDPRIFRRDAKGPNIPFNQSSQYQTFATSSPAASTATHYQPTASPYDPRNRAQHIVPQPSPQTPAQNAIVSYGANSSALSLPSTSSIVTPGGAMQQFMPSPMTVVAAVQPPTTPQQQQQQTPNMILYESIQNSSWYHGLPSSSKMQVNQSVTHLVTALNNFQRERRLNPTIVFDIFKLDNAIELLDIMKNLSIFVDMNGNIIKQQPQQPPQPQVTSYAGHPCQQQISPGPQTQQTCNAMYSFIQQVLAPAAQCGARMPCSASSSMHEPFVSCYVDPPRTATMSSSCCGGHKHQHEEPITSNASPHPPAEDNYNDNRRGNYNNQFRKPYNQNQSQKPYNNQRFNNNPRFSKPFAYGSGNGNGGGGGDSFSPTRTSSPPLQQSFSPRGGGGGGVGRYNRRQQTIGCDGGSSWASSSSSPPSSSAKPFNNNRRFNRNNNFNRNSSYGNNNSSSPTRATSPPSSRYGNYNKSSSPPLPDQKSPPPLSPRRPDMPPQRATSPVLSSPVKQKQPPSTDEECWD